MKLPTKAVILARGLGTRMRTAAPRVALTSEQARIASGGIKTLIPVYGDKTLLDLIVDNLNAVGFGEVCLVIGPEHDSIRDYCAAERLAVTFAVQHEPRGTADAVLASAQFIDQNELFLVVNSDNLYSADSLRRLRAINAPAMLAFERKALIEKGNISENRIAKFATIETDQRGDLRHIVEKPGAVAPNSLVSMNAWLFSQTIFAACRSIGPSERGEFEITAAVQYAIDELGERFVAVSTADGVLDLSSRGDIASIARYLSN